MQVRMPTFSITDEDRRAIRFAKSHRRTMCNRNEAREFLQAAVEQALTDLRFRWDGTRPAEDADEAPVLLSSGRPFPV